MFYKFYHACDGPLIDRINTDVGVENYFLVCIGDENYLYYPDRYGLYSILQILSESKILLHGVPEEEFREIVNQENVSKFNSFHGSVLLFNALWKSP